MRSRLNDHVFRVRKWNTLAFKRPRIQFERPRMRARLNDHVCARAFIYDDVFRISIDYILELLARFARSPITTIIGKPVKLVSSAAFNSCAIVRILMN